MCRQALAVLAMIVFMNVTGFSTTIWDNGSPNGVDGWTINDGITEADDFILATAANIGRVTFSAASNVNAPIIALNYRLYSSVAGSPAAIIEQGAAQNLSSTLVGTVACCGSLRFATSFDIAPVSLNAGTYWLALYDANNGTSFRVFWETTADRLGTAGFAQAFEPEFAFTVIGVSGPFGPRSLILVAGCS
jgi:hypothetical protein